MPDGSVKDNFAILDETGKECEYFGTQGSVPPIYGTWCGPNSPNDKIPTPEFLDSYAMLHDCDYHNLGWFSLEGDLKFCSRIKQNLHRMSGREYATALFSLKYFETIGRMLAITKTNSDYIPTAASEDVVEPNDLFSELLASSDPNDRIKFFKGLKDGFIQTEDIIQTSQVASNANVLGSLIVVDY